MKHSKLILAAIAATVFSITAANAKNLVIKIGNVRSDKGKVLVMANIPGVKEPVYQMVQAKNGEVVIELKDLIADVAEISVFHDENENFKMDMGERGPVEGYLTKKCKLKGEINEEKAVLYYPE